MLHNCLQHEFIFQSRSVDKWKHSLVPFQPVVQTRFHWVNSVRRKRSPDNGLFLKKNQFSEVPAVRIPRPLHFWETLNCIFWSQEIFYLMLVCPPKSQTWNFRFLYVTVSTLKPMAETKFNSFTVGDFSLFLENVTALGLQFSGLKTLNSSIMKFMPFAKLPQQTSMAQNNAAIFFIWTIKTHCKHIVEIFNKC